ncbi:hypothetical protein [Microbacterium oleivorans]|uniref:hypothetical protein n=1 Tax=Microbacterium oleivorans TaxID=273677 RepID=UPI000F8F1463|nr:hypothetical protein [Microbacterium oleivorans]
MTDPMIIAGGIASAPLVLETTKRLLGPTLDLLGDGIKNGLANRKSNISKVAARADAKADTSEPGAIPPRVAAEVFDKAQWADDEFVTEYLSGMLASARTPAGTDDSAVSWTALVGRMSADQLRLHYALYTALRAKVAGKKFDNISEWESKEVFVGYSDLRLIALGWDQEFFVERLVEAAVGLAREGLITQLGHGSSDFLARVWSPTRKKALPDGQFGFLVFTPTSAGSVLFLRAHGYRAHSGVLAEAELDVSYSGDPQDAPGAINSYWVEDLPPFNPPG